MLDKEVGRADLLRSGGRRGGEVLGSWEGEELFGSEAGRRLPARFFGGDRVEVGSRTAVGVADLCGREERVSGEAEEVGSAPTPFLVLLREERGLAQHSSSSPLLRACAYV